MLHVIQSFLQQPIRRLHRLLHWTLFGRMVKISNLVSSLQFVYEYRSPQSESVKKVSMSIETPPKISGCQWTKMTLISHCFLSSIKEIRETVRRSGRADVCHLGAVWNPFDEVLGWSLRKAVSHLIGSLLSLSFCMRHSLRISAVSKHWPLSLQWNSSTPFPCNALQ